MSEHDTERPTRRTALLIAWGLLGALAILIIAIGGWQWAGSRREDLAQWVMAGASVVTLLAATGAAVFAAGAYRVELQRETRFLDAQRRSQAERVAAWGVFDHVWQSPADPSKGALKVHFEFRNASDLPVYNVLTRAHIRFALEGDAEEEFTRESARPILPPGDASGPLDLIDLDLPGSFLLAGPGDQMRMLAEPLCDIGVTVQFKDTAGRVWQRLPDGRLLDKGRA